ncbi:hypothetical protein E4T56_gene7995, partial [Termitomyces sp. T112]
MGSPLVLPPLPDSPPSDRSGPIRLDSTSDEYDDSSSSDVEIYLNCEPSPTLPPAPARLTIPLPDLSSPEPSHPDTKPDMAGKTPNVYINGLPPHFPEDQLYALAAPFGPVRSVRTFTRHVRDSESGYGFVLFESIDAAEKCIASLRRYRNLHPTFSKQAHKIPGMRPHPPLDIHLGALRAESEWDNEAEGGVPAPLEAGARDSVDAGPGHETTAPAPAPAAAGSAAFKAKMESLHDKSSTNLYMEGFSLFVTIMPRTNPPLSLPLSIDEQTLAALVSPHRISSSRFFQTRLSNPPRIIAFVRFETRAGAEEIIERLHGRMVRGWNDAGSRISVRFADTAEQRELRRTERMTREGEESPARLTIAQAALLNLHGQDLRVPGAVSGASSVSASASVSNKPPSVSPAASVHSAYPHPHPHLGHSVHLALPPPPPQPSTRVPTPRQAMQMQMQMQMPVPEYQGQGQGRSAHPHLGSGYPNAHAHAHAQRSRGYVRTPPFAVDYSLAPVGRGYTHAQQQRSDAMDMEMDVGIGMGVGEAGQGQGQGVHVRGMDPAMAALFDSLHVGHGENEFASNRHGGEWEWECEDGYGYGYGREDGYGRGPGSGRGRGQRGGYRYGGGRGGEDGYAFEGEDGYAFERPVSRGVGGHAHAHHAYTHQQHQHQHQHQQYAYHGQGQGQGRSASVRAGAGGGGYTATEEFIMRAHADSVAARQQQQYSNSSPLMQQYQTQTQTQLRRRPAPPPLDLAPNMNTMRKRRDSESVGGGGETFGVGARAYKSAGAGYSPAMGSVPLV